MQIADLAGKSDQELVELAKADSDNYRFLMERYRNALFRYAQRITGLVAEDVEDILQETFVKMYRNLNDYDTDLKFSSWAYRIAHNASVDHLRKLNVRPKSWGLDETDFARLIPDSSDLANDAANKDLAERAKVAMQELPLNYREALVLRYLDEKSYEEMVDILKKPKGTVASLIDRGRKLLAERMKMHAIK